MTTRNDPCPCGSGLKYKRCCQPDERQLDGAGRVLASARRTTRAGGPLNVDPEAIGAEWEIDLVPSVATIDATPEMRMSVLMVACADAVLHVDIPKHPPSEHDAIAELLAAAVEDTIRAHGVVPTRVTVRYATLVAMMRARLASHGIDVTHGDIPAFDQAHRAMREAVMGESPDAPRIALPHRWAAWGWPAETVGEMFRAFAEYYRAAPWDLMGDDEVLTIEVGGQRWYGSVMGAAAETWGLALYASADDVRRLFEQAAGDDVLTAMRDAVFSVTYDSFDALPPGMHREIRKAGWEVAGPRAYPTLFVLNTPGGGVTDGQRGTVRDCVRAVAGFAATHRGVFATARAADLYPQPFTWRDPVTGIAISYDGPWMDDLDPPGLGPPALVCAQGPKARPGAFIGVDAARGRAVRAEEARLQRFAEWLRLHPAMWRPGKGTSMGTLRKRHIKMVQELLTTMVFNGGTCAGISELDLRVFLYHAYPQIVRRGTRHQHVLDALLLFFEFLETSEGIVCPWAYALLEDIEALEFRCEALPRGKRGEDMEEWRDALALDFDFRLLQPMWTAELSAAIRADDRQRIDRAWLRWRDEIVEAGETRWGRLAEQLMDRLRSEVKPSAL